MNHFEQTVWTIVDKPTVQCVANLYAETRTAVRRSIDRDRAHVSIKKELQAYANYMRCVTVNVPDVDQINRLMVDNMMAMLTKTLELQWRVKRSVLTENQALSDPVYQHGLAWLSQVSLVHVDAQNETIEQSVNWFKDKFVLLLSQRLLDTSKDTRTKYVAIFKSLFTPMEFDSDHCVNLKWNLMPVNDSPHLLIQNDVCERRMRLTHQQRLSSSSLITATSNANDDGDGNSKIIDHDQNTFASSDWAKLNEKQLQYVATLYCETLKMYTKKVWHQSELKESIAPNWEARFDAYEHWLQCQTNGIKHVEQFNAMIDQSLANVANQVATLIEQRNRDEPLLLAHVEILEPLSDRLSGIVRRYCSELPVTSSLHSNQCLPFKGGLWSCVNCLKNV